MGMADGETSTLRQLSYQVEQRANLQPSTLGPFHIGVFNRIRKATGGQKLSELKVFTPKTLNMGSASKKKKGQATTNDGTTNPLTVFLKELGIDETDWETVKGAMDSMGKGKLKASRQLDSQDQSLSSRACVFWTRSRDILKKNRGNNSDRLGALAYSFIISFFVHRPMIVPDLKGNKEWLWEAWECRSSFQVQIEKLLKCSNDADWVWADHIALPAKDYDRPTNQPYLEAYYQKQLKTIGLSAMDNIEKLNAAAKGIMNAAGRFRLHAVPHQVRQNIAALTNEYVEVCAVHTLLNIDARD